MADYSVSGRSSNSKETQSVDDTVCRLRFTNIFALFKLHSYNVHILSALHTHFMAFRWTITTLKTKTMYLNFVQMQLRLKVLMPNIPSITKVWYTYAIFPIFVSFHSEAHKLFIGNCDDRYCIFHFPLGEDGGFLSQTTALPPIDGEIPATADNDAQNQSLVAAPNKVEKILIGYAKQAKKMDMRKLKVIEWNTLQQLSKKAVKEDKENKDDNGVEKESSTQEAEDITKRMILDTVVDFTDLYQRLYDPKSRMPPKMVENLSVPLAFVALLHLCNENNLALENVADFSDFKIQQG